MPLQFVSRFGVDILERAPMAEAREGCVHFVNEKSNSSCDIAGILELYLRRSCRLQSVNGRWARTEYDAVIDGVLT